MATEHNVLGHVRIEQTPGGYFIHTRNRHRHHSRYVRGPYSDDSFRQALNEMAEEEMKLLDLYGQT